MGDESMNRNKISAGFTLAEMMVVMLILTIVLAAFAPMMTKRKTVDLTSPWRYAANNSDAYFGLAAQQTALLGKNSKSSDDISSKLLINTLNNSQAHISFLSSGTRVGQLYMNGSNLILGGDADTISTSFSNNTAIGYNALSNNTGGDANTALGSNALYSNKTGSYNTAIGYGALYNSTARGNTAVGYQAGYSSTTNSENTILGYQALKNATSSSNTAVGHMALSSLTTGGANTALGDYAGDAFTTSDQNTAIGVHALTNNITGRKNTALGYTACSQITGSNKTCIGAGSGPSGVTAASDNSEVVYLGTSDSTVYIPGNLVVAGTVQANNTMYIGSSGENGRVAMKLNGEQHRLRWGDQAVKQSSLDGSIPGYGQYSDKRLKNIKSENKSGLEKIRELKVYDFTFKNDKDKTPQVGVVAQDLQKVFPNAVKEDMSGYLTIRKDDIFYAMVNSIKQLDSFVQGIINELKVVYEKITGIDNRVKILEEENKLLKEQIKKMNDRLDELEDDDDDD